MPAQAQRETFRASYQQALTNSNLRQTLSKATAQFVAAQKNAASDLGQEEWERLRHNARQIKDHTLARLDYYLEQFSTSVERLGGHVHWAASAAEANRCIAGIAAARHVRLVVKSKSMATEEIELNRALADAGIEAVETDLGEYIIQLAGERPSHVIAPAIHKSRRDVASLFSEKLKVDCPEQIGGITALARRVLRERFATAGIGITGVNFAVAETGTLVLVENEGNIRMTTSLPPVHVAVMGIEKLVPRLVDLEPFLRLLPRSASGQKASSYVSFLTGVKSAGRQEGPEELHVVILDNGRTKMLAHPHLREALNCIRCGACLNVCPVYQTIGGHAYGSVYTGPIGAVLTLPMAGGERAAELPFASTLCGACRDACPVKLDIPKMLVQLRREVVEPARTKIQPYARERLRKRMALLVQHVIFMIWAWTMSAPHRYRRAARVVRFGQRWRRMSALPSFSRRSFREQWSCGSVPPAVAGGSTIGITCSRGMSSER
jgi:L-lactate dehydrogenase complex protein LldF